MGFFTLFKKKDEANPVKEKYENEFEKDEFEITVLIKDGCHGAACYQRGWRIPQVIFLACLDTAANEIIEKKGIIQWLIEDTKKKGSFGLQGI